MTSDKLKKLFPDAYEYLENLTEEEKEKINFDGGPYLYGMFNWSKTPQGHEYWKEIEEIIAIN